MDVNKVKNGNFGGPEGSYFYIKEREEKDYVRSNSKGGKYDWYDTGGK